MRLVDFSNDKLEQSKPFTPTYPDGAPMDDAKIYLRSAKSMRVVKAVDRAEKQYRQSGNSVEKLINKDIDICCSAIESISGFTIEEKDNSFGFELDGNKVISNEKNIRLLMQNFAFLRSQVGAKILDDNFFYES